MSLEHLCATGRAARAHACRASDHSCQPAAASSAAASERRKPCVASEGSLFAAHGGFLFLFSFPSPFCALHEADRLDRGGGGGGGGGGGEPLILVYTNPDLHILQGLSRSRLRHSDF